MFMCPKSHVVNNAVMSLLLLALFSVAGCVSQPASELPKATGPVFYPSPPEAPRYQFLTSFKGPEDFGVKASGLSSFLGGQGNKEFIIKKPYGVLVRNGVVFLADTSDGVFLFDTVNKQFLPFKGSKGPGKIVEPINIRSDKDGNIYVCDPSRKQVLQYDSKEFFVRAFSNPDPWKPVDAAAYEGKLYVADSTGATADTKTGGIKVFDLKSGQLLETMGLTGSPEQRIGIAVGITIDSDGYLYVTDAHKFKIMKYDRDGHFRGGLGGPGDGPGFFGRPRGVAVDRTGRLYAVDAAFDVVQVYAATGQLLTFFGNAEDTEPGALTMPAGIQIDYDNIQYFKQYAAPGFEIEYLILVTSQFNLRQVVNVYGFGRMQGVPYKSDKELYQELLEKQEREKAEKAK